MKKKIAIRVEKLSSMTAEELSAEENRVAAVRMQLLECHPFWGYLFLQVKPVPAPMMPGFAMTDQVKHIWYNPLWTRHLTFEQLGFVMLHEICHTVFQTIERRGNREPERWNCATDYAINLVVAAVRNPGTGARMYNFTRVVLPGQGEIHCLLDEKYKDMNAESIYEHLPAHFSESSGAGILRVLLPGPGANGAGGGCEGIGPENLGDCHGGDRTSLWERLRELLGRRPPAPPLPPQAAPGSEIPLEEVVDHGGGIDLHYPGNLTKKQQEDLVHRLRAAVESWQSGGSRGDCPGGLEERLRLPSKVEVPWQRLFHRFAEQALGLDDYTYAHPNKHYLSDGFVVPGKYAEMVQNVVIALDSSGSMGPEEIKAVAKELRGIVPYVSDMTMIVADAAVQQVIPKEQIEAFLQNFRVKGGGGTSHKPVFQYIKDHRLHPVLFIGMSDLYSEFPQKRPNYPVLWLAPRNHGIPPPWGKVLVVRP